MVKHTQTIRREFADELSGRVRPFCEVGLKGLKIIKTKTLKSKRM